MANIFPKSLVNITGPTQGERKLFALLKQIAVSDSGFNVWYEPTLTLKNPKTQQDEQRRPDFIIYDERLGFIVVEVKDWKKYSLSSMNPEQFGIRSLGSEAVRLNPFEQARRYAYALKDWLRTKAAFLSQGTTGKFLMPIGQCVVFSNITQAEAENNPRIVDVIEQRFCLFSDDINGDSDQAGIRLRNRLRHVFNAHFAPPTLTESQKQELRIILYPETHRDQHYLDLSRLGRENFQEFEDAVQFEIMRREEIENRPRHFIFGKVDTTEYVIDERYGAVFENVSRHVLDALRKMRRRYKGIANYTATLDAVLKVGDIFLEGRIQDEKAGSAVLVSINLESDINRAALSEIEDPAAWLSESTNWGLEYVADDRPLLENLGSFFNELIATNSQTESHRLSRPSMAPRNRKENTLNPWQEAAVAKSLEQRITYIWGPPGTGKTKTLAVLVSDLMSYGRRVLLCSTSNLTVDMLLGECLKQLGDKAPSINIARTGSDRDDKEGDLLYWYTRQAFESKAEWYLHLKNSRIVASTFASLVAKGQSERLGQFDYVIIDEISMASVPTLAAAATYAKESVVLAGDPMQLPPIWAEGTEPPNPFFSDSIFIHAGFQDKESLEVVDDGSDPRIVQLKMQYRMHPRIGGLVSDMFYGRHPLKDGKGEHDEEYLLPTLPSEWDGQRVLLLHGRYEGEDAADREEARYNKAHASLIVSAVTSLLNSNIAAADIGVIAPYNAQVALITNLLKNQHPTVFEQGLRVATVHSFQGQENKVIIVDVTDDDVPPTPLTSKRELINVGLSRAKSLLIIIANPEYLQNSHYFDELEIQMFNKMLGVAYKVSSTSAFN